MPTPAQSPSSLQRLVTSSNGSGSTTTLCPRSEQPAASGPHSPWPPLIGALQLLASPGQPAQSASVSHVPAICPGKPQMSTHTPCGLHSWPGGHGNVSEHSAHWCALQACASWPGPPHDEQSASALHDSGQSPAHAPITQCSVVWQCDSSLAVHATHCEVAVSQSWCRGSQAAQSASERQTICGTPSASAGHVTPSGTQLPHSVQYSPSAQPSPVSMLHATQRCCSTSHVLRFSSQPAQCRSSSQLLSRQMSSPTASSVPSVSPASASVVLPSSSSPVSPADGPNVVGPGELGMPSAHPLPKRSASAKRLNPHHPRTSRFTQPACCMSDIPYPALL